MRKIQRKRISMVKLRELLRLLSIKNELSLRQIAISIKVSPTTVTKYTDLINKHGLTYEAASSFNDDELRELIFPDQISKPLRVLPDMREIHRDLSKKNVTLQLLWEEYNRNHPDGYSLSQFKFYYHEWSKSIDPVMKQTYKAGEKLFIDYAGTTMEIQNPDTGELLQVQIFVAVMGASNYMYAEATRSQQVEDFISSHIRCFQYFGAVPHVLVPDNLKSGVKHACYYEPDINPTYNEMAKYYKLAVIPARVRKPRDKAKVESAVGYVSRQILASLRNRPFFSLNELNQAIRERLDVLNQKPFQKLSGTRQQWFIELDKPQMQPLPEIPYDISYWKKATVNIDYHIELEQHYYSVPYLFAHKHVLVRYTATTVEIFENNKRIASHARHFKRNSHTTIPEHMPSSHRYYSEWSPSRIIKWANQVGVCVGKVVEKILLTKNHPEQGYRSAMGIIRLEKRFGKDALELTCQRALEYNVCYYKKIEEMLMNKVVNLPISTTTDQPPVKHCNIRGQDYYN